KGTPKGGVLVIHEWWGLTDWVKHMADRLAGEGYLALAVDLYKGKVTKDPKEAMSLMQAKDEKWGDAVEEAGLEWLKANAGGVTHEFHAYDAGHGFANPSSGAYQSPAAKDAWERTRVFLAANLK